MFALLGCSLEKLMKRCVIKNLWYVGYTKGGSGGQLLLQPPLDLPLCYTTACNDCILMEVQCILWSVDSKLHDVLPSIPSKFSLCE